MYLPAGGVANCLVDLLLAHRFRSDSTFQTRVFREKDALFSVVSGVFPDRVVRIALFLGWRFSSRK